MRRLFIIMALAALLGACSRGNPSMQDKARAPQAYGGVAQAAAPMAGAPAQAGEARTRYLAYSHSVNLELEAAKVAPLFEAVQAACRAAVAEDCVVLRASLSSGTSPLASLQVRATAAGIAKIMTLLSTQGTTLGRSTQADDLTGAIEDAARRRALLEDYRTRLEGLRPQAAQKLETLMQLQHELAQVQSQLETLAGEQARMMRRVQTEVLSIEIGSRERVVVARNPVWLALGNFGANLSEALAGTINFVAYALPFGLLFAAFIWVLRWLWMRRKRPVKGG